MSDNTPTLFNLADRIGKLMNQKDETEEMIKEIYAEARSVGFDVKILKRAISIARLSEEDQKKRLAEDDVLHVYLQQLNLPL